MDRPASDSSIERLRARIRNDHTYHPPSPEQLPKFLEIRETVKGFALRLTELVPEGRELSRALTALEDVVFNANAGIARSTPADRSDHPQPNSRI